MNNFRKAILVTGTGIGRSAAGAYYAPLIRSLGEASQLHVLSRWGFAPIERSVGNLVHRLRCQGERVTLVGHSQGGVVATGAAEIVPDLIEQVVTICAPLQGTKLAPAWSPLSSLRSMSPSQRRPGNHRAIPPMINVVATADRLVVPYTSGLQDGAEQYVLDRVGHCGIIWDVRLHRLVKSLMSRSAVGARSAA